MDLFSAVLSTKLKKTCALRPADPHCFVTAGASPPPSPPLAALCALFRVLALPLASPLPTSFPAPAPPLLSPWPPQAPSPPPSAAT